MSYTHLSNIERSKLEILHQQGKSSRAIAKELGSHPSTICRELARAAQSEGYQAEKAQWAYRERRKTSVPTGKWSDTQAASLEEKLQATWSPEQITERFRIDGLPVVSFKTMTAGSTMDGSFEGNYKFSVIKGSVRNPQRRVVNLPLAGPFQPVRRKSVLVKRLGTGNWIPSFQDAEKVKGASPRSSNAKHGCIPRF